MNGDLLSIFRDFVATGFQIWCLTLLFVNEKKKKGIALVVLLWGMITGTVVFMSYLNILIPIKLIVIIALVVIVGKKVYICSYNKLLLYGIIFVCVEYCSELMAIQSWNYFNKPIYSSNPIYDDFSFLLILIANMICYILTFILGKVMKPKESRMKFKDIYPCIIQGIPLMMILFGIQLALQRIGETAIRMWFLIGSTGICIAFVFNIMYIQNYLKMLDERRNEERALNDLKMKNEYYLQKLEVEERIKSIYHDLKNYFILSDQKMIGKEIRKKLNLYEKYYETGNEFLNIILAEKIGKALENEIYIECHVDFSKGNFMNALDISTIFGNLLDNALEATEKIDKNERYIIFDVATKRNLLIISIRNSMIKCEENIYRKGKWNKTFHGYGVKNVEKSLDNYNGRMKINIKEGEFGVNIVIPIPVRKYEEKKF